MAFVSACYLRTGERLLEQVQVELRRSMWLWDGGYGASDKNRGGGRHLWPIVKGVHHNEDAKADEPWGCNEDEEQEPSDVGSRIRLGFI